jgi:hypothetical protein
MSNGNDHDLLISLNTKVSTMFNSIEEMKSDFKDFRNTPLPCNEQAEKCIGKMEVLSKDVSKRITWSSFIIMVTFLTGIIGSIIYYNFQLDGIQFKSLSTVQQQVIENTKDIKHLHGFENGNGNVIR